MNAAAPAPAPAALTRDLLATRLAFAPRLLAFDVDGTLAPIVKRPADAAIPAEARDALLRLAADGANHVVFVSGRGAADARRLVGLDRVWTIGNHGFERIAPDGSVEIAPGARRWIPRIVDAAAEAESLAGCIRGVQVEDKRWTLSVHWRNADPAEAPRIHDLLAAVAARNGLRLSEGRRVFELRPPLEVNKGTALVSLAESVLAESLLASPGEVSVFYAGDDATDEDAFAALRNRFPGAVTVRVLGDRDEDSVGVTQAELALPGVPAMHEALGWLAERFGSN